MAKKARSAAASKSTKQPTSAAKKNAGKKGADKRRMAAAPRKAKAAANNASATPTLPLAANLPAGTQAVQKAPKVTPRAAAKSVARPTAESEAGPTREMHMDRVEDALGAFVATIADAERLRRQLDRGISNEPE